MITDNFCLLCGETNFSYSQKYFDSYDSEDFNYCEVCRPIIRKKHYIDNLIEKRKRLAIRRTTEQWDNYFLSLRPMRGSLEKK